MVSSNYTTVKSSMEVGFPNQLWNTYSRPLSLSSCILPNLPIVYYYYVFSIVWLSTSFLRDLSGFPLGPIKHFYDSETFFPTTYSTMMTDFVHISSQGIVQNLYKKNHTFGPFCSCLVFLETIQFLTNSRTFSHGSMYFVSPHLTYPLRAPFVSVSVKVHCTSMLLHVLL